MTKTPAPVLSVPQYCLLRSLKTAGVPRDLKAVFVGRSGATDADWAWLEAAGYVGSERGRYVLTAVGRRVYNKRPKTLYF